MSGVTLCIPLIFTASAPVTFTSDIETINAECKVFGTKQAHVWGNISDNLFMSFTQGCSHGAD